MKRTTLIAFLSMVSYCQLHAQISMNVNIQGPTPGACDGSVEMTVDGVGNLNGVSLFFPLGALEYTSSATTVSLANACSNTDYLSGFEVENDSCVKIMVGSIRSQNPGTTNLAAQADYNFTINIELPTTEFSADGSITLVSADLGDFEIIFQRSDLLTASLFFPFLSAQDTVGYGMSVDGLNAGSYMIVIQDDLQPSTVAHTQFGFVLEPSGFAGCQDSIVVIPMVTPASDNVWCDGSVEVLGWGTVGPYQYEHSSGATTSVDTALCDGLYSVLVYDQAGNNTSASYLIPALSNVVNSVNWPFDPDLDTLFTTATENCDLDFTLPIDSVFIDGIYIIDSLMCQAIWHFYQAGEVYSMTHHYVYDGFGPYIFSLGAFCVNGRAALGYYFAYDAFDLNDALFIGIQEEEQQLSFSVSPNPSSGMYNLQLPLVADHTVQVVDMKDALVHSASFNGVANSQLDLSGLHAGIYVLRVQTDAGVGIQRIVKQ